MEQKLGLFDFTSTTPDTFGAVASNEAKPKGGLSLFDSLLAQMQSDAKLSNPEKTVTLTNSAMQTASTKQPIEIKNVIHETPMVIVGEQPIDVASNTAPIPLVGNNLGLCGETADKTGIGNALLQQLDTTQHQSDEVTPVVIAKNNQTGESGEQVSKNNVVSILQHSSLLSKALMGEQLGAIKGNVEIAIDSGKQGVDKNGVVLTEPTSQLKVIPARENDVTDKGVQQSTLFIPKEHLIDTKIVEGFTPVIPSLPEISQEVNIKETELGVVQSINSKQPSLFDMMAFNAVQNQAKDDIVLQNRSQITNVKNSGEEELNTNFLNSGSLHTLIDGNTLQQREVNLTTGNASNVVAMENNVTNTQPLGDFLQQNDIDFVQNSIDKIAKGNNLQEVSESIKTVIVNSGIENETIKTSMESQKHQGLLMVESRPNEEIGSASIVAKNIDLSHELISNFIQPEELDKAVGNLGVGEASNDIPQVAIQPDDEVVSPKLVGLISTQTPEVVVVGDDARETPENKKLEVVKTVQKTLPTQPKIVSFIDDVISTSSATTTVNIKEKTDIQTIVQSVSQDLPRTQKEDLLNSIYLGSQKNSSHLASMMIASEGKKILNNGETTIANVKKSANVLGLGLESIAEVKEELKVANIANVLSKEEKTFEELVHARVMFVTKEMVDELSLNTSEVKIAQQGLVENVVTLKIADSIANSFESKIIGARQQINTMMSDVARTMYENYKPPVSAFRLSLNPSSLGSIAIVLKSDKVTMDISMSMTHNTTLETFIDNQATLKNQIAKAFGDTSNINLNFSMQGDSTNQSNSNGAGSNNNQGKSQTFSESLNNKEELIQEEHQEKNQSYM